MKHGKIMPRGCCFYKRRWACSESLNQLSEDTVLTLSTIDGKKRWKHIYEHADIFSLYTSAQEEKQTLAHSTEIICENLKSLCLSCFIFNDSDVWLIAKFGCSQNKMKNCWTTVKLPTYLKYWKGNAAWEAEISAGMLLIGTIYVPWHWLFGPPTSKIRNSVDIS